MSVCLGEDCTSIQQYHLMENAFALKLRTLVELNPIRCGSNIISFQQGNEVANTKTYFSNGNFNVNCLRDKVYVVKDGIISMFTMSNAHIIYVDENHVVVMAENDQEHCLVSIISTKIKQNYNVPHDVFEVVEYKVDNPNTSHVVHRYDGIIRSISYDNTVLNGKATTCISGSLICDSQYSYIAGDDHVYSRFYNPFTGKCLMFDQSGVTHEYGSIFTKDGIHVEVDSSYLY